MATTPSSPHGAHTDAAAQLQLLDRAKSTAQVDEFLDFGPWWYAPLMASVVGGLSLFGQPFENGAWDLGAGVIALVAGVVMSIHDYRRRSIRSRPSWRGAIAVAGIVVVCWAVVAAWGTAISSIGLDRFVPAYAAVGWVLTTAFFLAVREALEALRRRRAPLL